MSNINPVLLENIFSKAHGGTNRGTADNFISGYFYTFFIDLPDIAVCPPIITSTIDSFKYLSGTCLSFTPPSITLNKTTAMGAGTAKSSVPTNIDISDSVTTRHSEYDDLPTSRLLSNWVYSIRDPQTGGTNIDNYKKSKYSCTIVYVILKPDWKTIQRAIVVTGCFPDKDPMDLFDGDYQTHDLKEVDITWSCDKVYDSNNPVQRQWVMGIAAGNVISMIPIIEEYRVGLKYGGPTIVR